MCNWPVELDTLVSVGLLPSFRLIILLDITNLRPLLLVMNSWPRSDGFNGLHLIMCWWDMIDTVMVRGGIRSRHYYRQIWEYEK